jgi:hypothetical protein
LVSYLDDLRIEQVWGATRCGLGLRPTFPRRRRRYTTPRTWSSAAG